MAPMTPNVQDAILAAIDAEKPVELAVPDSVVVRGIGEAMERKGHPFLVA